MAIQFNWKELELLVHQIAPKVEGLFVERIIVPSREFYPEGYLKGEWVLRLTGRKQEGILLMSIRPRNAYLAWSEGKGPQACSKATRSPFDLCLSKYLKGAKLLKCEALPKERVVVLQFSEPDQSQNRLGLVLVFIPAAPEAFLVSIPPQSALSEQKGWPILARSRTVRDEAKAQTHYIPPNGLQAPPSPPIRTEIIASSEVLYQFLEKELTKEAFDLRVQSALKAVKHLIKHIQDRLRQSETSLQEAQKEENWQKLGDLLKASLGFSNENSLGKNESIRKVVDYESGEEISVRCDPQLTLKEQIEKFYQNAKRKHRRIHEAKARMDRFEESLLKLQQALAGVPSEGDWKALEKLERLSLSPTQDKLNRDPKGKKSELAWLGKIFVSRDGLNILVGRSKDENLELTFKHARGNDIWMHVRGRPGAHVLIPLSPGKSAPLETLLDAATLAIHYSGGQNWGKTEVDYTFKKYVKRIKDSTEASYTHNKTLLVDSDPARTQRLLGPVKE